jgi:hypothetical protein
MDLSISDPRHRNPHNFFLLAKSCYIRCGFWCSLPRQAA